MWRKVHFNNLQGENPKYWGAWEQGEDDLGYLQGLLISSFLENLKHTNIVKCMPFQGDFVLITMPWKKLELGYAVIHYI